MLLTLALFACNQDNPDDSGLACVAEDEVCNGIDDDCDGDVDEEVLLTFFADSDADGFGDSATEVEACEAPSGFVEDSTDCDDSLAAANPGAQETCSGIDDDCDGLIDDDDDSLTVLDVAVGSVGQHMTVDMLRVRPERGSLGTKARDLVQQAAVGGLRLVVLELFEASGTVGLELAQGVELVVYAVQRLDAGVVREDAPLQDTARQRQK
ncbi:MAG TPA: MopE-related protein [Myxococcota bacterium]|nr:MopE-related protein [Myxococcota bacterium]